MNKLGKCLKQYDMLKDRSEVSNENDQNLT